MLQDYFHKLNIWSGMASATCYWSAAVKENENPFSHCIVLFLFAESDGYLLLMFVQWCFVQTNINEMYSVANRFGMTGVFPSVPRYDWCASCHIHLPVCLWIMNPHSRAPKKNTSHGNEVLLQDTTHLTQRPCYQRGSPCQDPAGNQTTQKSPDNRKETQTAVVWSCLPFIRSGQNHLARYSERGKKTRQTKEEVGRQLQGTDRPGVRQVPEGSGEQGKWRKLVAKSTAVPLRPFRLRDRWW